jgi:tRNA dimethylallyltransferase
MPPLIVIVGETASGKSALAMEVAQRLGGELICADSWTVYAGFDIGSAKPSAQEKLLVPHHLLDVANPLEGFSAVRFQELARETIVDITSRGRVPIMVGGTGLYVDSVLYEYSFLGAPSPELRAELNALTLNQLIERAENAGYDLTGIDLRNKRRVIRLIENNGLRPTKRDMRPNTLVLGLRTPREVLLKRVTARVDAMLAAGLEAEVRELVERYGWEVEPMKGIGYREWREYFLGVQDLAETRARIIKSTIDLAKRQRTWFKRNSSIQWLDDRSNAVEVITTFLNKSPLGAHQKSATM